MTSKVAGAMIMRRIILRGVMGLLLFTLTAFANEEDAKLETFFKSHSWVDGVLICPRRGESTFRQWLSFYRKLRSYGFDMCVLSPNHSCSNSVFLYLCGIREIVGAMLPITWPWHRNIENRFLTRRVTTKHMENSYRLLSFPEAYGKLLTGREDFKLAELLPFIRFQREQLPNLATARPKVAMHPGGPAHRRWPAENFAAIGARLAEQYDAAVLIIGGKEENDLASHIASRISELCPDAEVYNCCGCSVNQTMNYVANSVLYVGNNAGTMHIPAALGVPIIGIFPESDRWFSGPDKLGESHVVLARDNVADIPVREVSVAIEKTWHVAQLSASAAN